MMKIALNGRFSHVPMKSGLGVESVRLSSGTVQKSLLF